VVETAKGKQNLRGSKCYDAEVVLVVPQAAVASVAPVVW